MSRNGESPRDRNYHRNGNSYGMATVLGMRTILNMVTVLGSVIVQGLGLTIGPLIFIVILSVLHIENLGQTSRQTNR